MWTVPNILSFLRLGLVPVFLYLIVTAQDALALLVLVFSSLSDYLDGFIARRFNQMTRLGQLLDPAADRLFIFAALIGLAARNVIPWWLFFVIVARELMLAVLGIISANFGFGPLARSPFGQGGHRGAVLCASRAHAGAGIPCDCGRHRSGGVGIRAVGRLLVLVGWFHLRCTICPNFSPSEGVRSAPIRYAGQSGGLRWVSQ